MKLLDLLQNGDTSEWKKKNYFLPEYADFAFSRAYVWLG